MLDVLNYFRDLPVAERRRCLSKVLCDITSQAGRVPESQQRELCLLGADLLREILVDWEQGNQP